MYNKVAILILMYKVANLIIMDRVVILMLMPNVGLFPNRMFYFLFVGQIEMLRKITYLYIQHFGDQTVMLLTTC